MVTRLAFYNFLLSKHMFACLVAPLIPLEYNSTLFSISDTVCSVNLQISIEFSKIFQYKKEEEIME